MSADTDKTSGRQDEKRKLPAGWRWVRLGEVIQEAQAGFACGERDADGIVQLRMNNLDTRGNLFGMTCFAFREKATTSNRSC